MHVSAENVVEVGSTPTGGGKIQIKKAGPDRREKEATREEDGGGQKPVHVSEENIFGVGYNCLGKGMYEEGGRGRKERNRGN